MTATHHHESRLRASHHRGPARIGRQHPLVRRRGASLLVCLLAMALAGCGSGGTPSPPVSTTGPQYAISSSVVSDRSTQQIRVWAPTRRGHWPVIYALPGVGGSNTDFDRLGPALARHGTVVFAAGYRPNGSGAELVRDVVCGYRYVASIAGRYGGDLAKPVTGVGYSRGAQLIAAVRDPSFGPGGSYHACLVPAPAPGLLVGINGCYYVHDGVSQSFSVPRGSPDARVVLITGEADDVCRTWQSKKAAEALMAAGFDTTLVPIPGANHYTPIFHDLVRGKWISLSHDAAGERTAHAILDAVNAAG